MNVTIDHDTIIARCAR